MGSYTSASNTFNASVFIFDTSSLVLGGLLGASNKPVKELADNSGYLKKFKGRIIRNSGEPWDTGVGNPLSGFTTDVNTVNNTLYLDELTGSFWKPDDAAGLTWTNIYKSAVMNIKGVKINAAGDDTIYVHLNYNNTDKKLEFLREDGVTFADVRVGDVIYNTIDGSTINQAHIADQEVLLLFDISQNSENDDAIFSAKRIEDVTSANITITSFTESSSINLDRWFITVDPAITLSDYIQDGDYVEIRDFNEDTGESINGYYKICQINGAETWFTTYRNFNAIDGTHIQETGNTGTIGKDISALIKWDDTNTRWELVTRDDTLLPLNCAGFYINDVPLNFIADRVISTQAQFDELFANLEATGDPCYLLTPENNYTSIIENEYIALKPNADETDGHYDLGNSVVIMGSNVRIECLVGATINFTSDDVYIKVIDDTDIDIDTYKRDRRLEILTENCNYLSGANPAGTQVAMVEDDEIYMFSDTPTINKKYIINGITKSVMDTPDLDPSGTGVNDNLEITLEDNVTNIAEEYYYPMKFTSGGTDYILVIYSNNTDDIGYALYQYSTITNKYTKIGNGDDNGILDGSVDGETNCIPFKMVIANGNIHVVFHYAVGIKHIWSSVATVIADGAFNNANKAVISGAGTDNNPEIWVDDNNVVYISYINVLNQLEIMISNGAIPADGNPYVFGVAYVFDGLAGRPDSDTSYTERHSIIVNNSDVLISYAENVNTGDVDLNCMYSADGGTTFNKFRLDNSAQCGYYSKIILSQETDTGTNDFYIAYNHGATENIIRFAEIQIVSGTPSLSGKITAIERGEDAVFESLDIQLNTDNLYPSETNLVQIIGFNRKGGWPGQRWSLNTIDNAADVGEFTSITIDNIGNPIVSYYDVTNTSLKVAWYNGSTWDLTTVDSTVADVGQYTSITIDNIGNPIISYRDVTNTSLKVAWYNGSTWDLTTVDNTAIVGRFTSIAIDNNGNPIISYLDDNINDFLKVAWYNGSTWDLTTVDTADVGRFTSIAIDNNGNPIISYRDDNNTALKVAWYNGSTWDLTTVDNTADVGRFTSITIDNNGNPIISYRNDTNTSLKVAWYNGSTWDLTTVDNTADVGIYTSIAIDNNGIPIISYRDLDNTSLKVAWYNGLTWDLYTVDNTADVGEFTSIVINNDGTHIISYRDVTNTSLKVAWYLSPLYTSQSTDKTTWKNGGVDLIEFDNSGYIGSLYNDYLFLAYYNAQSDTGGYDDKNYLLKLYYNFEIMTNKIITITPTDLDVRISPDFIENLDLNLFINSDNYGGENVINLSNCVHSTIELNLRNSDHTDAISGEDVDDNGKTHNLILKPNIDDSCGNAYNLSKINHSTIDDCYVTIGGTTGAQNFNDCKNINIIGFVDDISTIASGDLNE